MNSNQHQHQHNGMIVNSNASLRQHKVALTGLQNHQNLASGPQQISAHQQSGLLSPQLQSSQTQMVQPIMPMVVSRHEGMPPNRLLKKGKQKLKVLKEKPAPVKPSILINVPSVGPNDQNKMLASLSSPNQSKYEQTFSATKDTREITNTIRKIQLTGVVESSDSKKVSGDQQPQGQKDEIQKQNEEMSQEYQQQVVAGNTGEDKTTPLPGSPTNQQISKQPSSESLLGAKKSDGDQTTSNKNSKSYDVVQLQNSTFGGAIVQKLGRNPFQASPRIGQVVENPYVKKKQARRKSSRRPSPIDTKRNYADNRNSNNLSGSGQKISPGNSSQVSPIEQIEQALPNGLEGKSLITQKVNQKQPKVKRSLKVVSKDVDDVMEMLETQNFGYQSPKNQNISRHSPQYPPTLLGKSNLSLASNHERPLQTANESIDITDDEGYHLVMHKPTLPLTDLAQIRVERVPQLNNNFNNQPHLNLQNEPLSPQTPITINRPDFPENNVTNLDELVGTPQGQRLLDQIVQLNINPFDTTSTLSPSPMLLQAKHQNSKQRKMSGLNLELEQMQRVDETGNRKVYLEGIEEQRHSSQMQMDQDVGSFNDQNANRQQMQYGGVVQQNQQQSQYQPHHLAQFQGQGQVQGGPTIMETLNGMRSQSMVEVARGAATNPYLGYQEILRRKHLQDSREQSEQDASETTNLQNRKQRDQSYDKDTSGQPLIGIGQGREESTGRDLRFKNQENAFKFNSPKSQMSGHQNHKGDLAMMRRDGGVGSQLTYKSGKIFFGLANSNRQSVEMPGGLLQIAQPKSFKIEPKPRQQNRVSKQGENGGSQARSSKYAKQVSKRRQKRLNETQGRDQESQQQMHEREIANDSQGGTHNNVKEGSQTEIKLGSEKIILSSKRDKEKSKMVTEFTKQPSIVSFVDINQVNEETNSTPIVQQNELQSNPNHHNNLGQDQTSNGHHHNQPQIQIHQVQNQAATRNNDTSGLTISEQRLLKKGDEMLRRRQPARTSPRMSITDENNAILNSDGQIQAQMPIQPTVYKMTPLPVKPKRHVRQRRSISPRPIEPIQPLPIIEQQFTPVPFPQQQSYSQNPKSGSFTYRGNSFISQYQVQNKIRMLQNEHKRRESADSSLGIGIMQAKMQEHQDQKYAQMAEKAMRENRQRTSNNQEDPFSMGEQNGTSPKMYGDFESETSRTHSKFFLLHNYKSSTKKVSVRASLNSSKSSSDHSFSATFSKPMTMAAQALLALKKPNNSENSTQVKFRKPQTRTLNQDLEQQLNSYEQIVNQQDDREGGGEGDRDDISQNQFSQMTNYLNKSQIAFNKKSSTPGIKEIQIAHIQTPTALNNHNNKGLFKIQLDPSQLKRNRKMSKKGADQSADGGSALADGSLKKHTQSRLSEQIDPELQAQLRADLQIETEMRQSNKRRIVKPMNAGLNDHRPSQLNLNDLTDMENNIQIVGDGKARLSKEATTNLQQQKHLQTLSDDLNTPFKNKSLAKAMNEKVSSKDTKLPQAAKPAKTPMIINEGGKIQLTPGRDTRPATPQQKLTLPQIVTTPKVTIGQPIIHVVEQKQSPQRQHTNLRPFQSRDALVKGKTTSKHNILRTSNTKMPDEAIRKINEELYSGSHQQQMIEASSSVIKKQTKAIQQQQIVQAASSVPPSLGNVTTTPKRSFGQQTNSGMGLGSGAIQERDSQKQLTYRSPVNQELPFQNNPMAALRIQKANIGVLQARSQSVMGPQKQPPPNNDKEEMYKTFKGSELGGSTIRILRGGSSMRQTQTNEDCLKYHPGLTNRSRFKMRNQSNFNTKERFLNKFNEDLI